MLRYMIQDAFQNGPSYSYANIEIGNIHRHLYRSCQFEPCCYISFEGKTKDFISDEITVGPQFALLSSLPSPERIRRMLYMADPVYYRTLIFGQQPIALLRYSQELQLAEDAGVYTVAARFIDSHPALPWKKIYAKVMTYTLKELNLKGYR